MNTLIEQLNGFSTAWLAALWKASWQGGLVILMAWAFCALPLQLSARWKVWLWRIALLKFIFAATLTFEIPLRLFPAPQAIASSVASESFSLPVNQLPSRLIVQPLPEVRATVSLNSSSWLLLMWFAVVGVAVARLLGQWAAAWRISRSARPIEATAIHEVLVDLSASTGCSRSPDLRVSEQIDAPLLVGVIRPRILIPESYAHLYSPAQLRLMLAHELGHCVHHDLVWNWLTAGVQSLFPFHPGVWLAARESRLAQEMASDEFAIAAVRARPSDYGTMLLAVVETARREVPGYFSVGVAGSKNSLKRRVLNMKTIPLTRSKHILAGALMSALLASVTLVPWKITAQDAKSATQPETPKESADAPKSPTPTPNVIPSADSNDEETAIPSKPKRKTKPLTLTSPGGATVTTGQNRRDDRLRAEVGQQDEVDEPRQFNTGISPEMAKRYGLDVKRMPKPLGGMDPELARRYGLAVPQPVPPPGVETEDIIGGPQGNVVTRVFNNTVMMKGGTREQDLRWKLFFKSGLARVRTLLNQGQPDLQEALNQVGQLRKKLDEESDRSKNPDVHSTTAVVQSLLGDLEDSISKSKESKNSEATFKVNTSRMRAIVEGLGELVSDVEAIVPKSQPMRF